MALARPPLVLVLCPADDLDDVTRMEAKVAGRLRLVVVEGGDCLGCGRAASFKVLGLRFGRRRLRLRGGSGG